MEILGILSIPSWLLWLTAVLVLSYFYLTKNHNYWKQRGIPYEPPYFILGGLYKMMTMHFHELEMQRLKRYGKVYGAFEGTKPVLTVADPELIKQILVKDFPSMSNRRNITFNDEMLDKMMSLVKVDEWRRIRPAVSPAFSSGKLRKMTPLLLGCTKALTENFEAAAKKGQYVDLKQYFSNFTMDVIARCAFGTKLNTQNDPYNPFVTMGRKIFGRDFSIFFLLLFFFPKIARLTGRSAFGATESFTFFKDLTLKIMGERNTNKTRQEDFLQLMMDAHKGSLKAEDTGVIENSLYTLGEQEHSNINLKSKELTLNEVLAQCVLFFLAGFDTTASVLSFTGYLLALNPEEQEKLLKEIDQHKEKYGDELTLDNINHLKYLDMVISESLRMCPPALRLERSPVEDYRLEGLGITIPKDMVVGIPAYAMHHDPEFFPDPEKFNPERFSDENISSIKPYTYLPFGAGPRNCVGMRFALMTVKCCLVSILRDVQFSRCSETKVPLDFYRGGGLLQPKEVTVAVTKRVKG